MRQKIANFIVTALEIGGAACLTYIAAHAEWKRHKAESELEDVKLACAVHEFGEYVKDLKIKSLEKKLEELKAKEKEA